MSFQELGLIPSILQAIAEQGYVKPTAIQSKAIGVILDKKDVLACAQTGTGKTASFALPILQQLSFKQSSVIRALVLTPTRELASQIEKNFVEYGAHLNVRSTVIFGGVGQKNQVRSISRGVDVLIATPGRLLDLMNQGVVNLSKIEIFVLDEADRMLDMGFIHDVQRIIKAIPQERQTLLFSATMPNDIKRLADKILDKPVMIKVNPVSSTAEQIQQSIYFVEKNRKVNLLTHLLQDSSFSRVLVFTRTKREANRVSEILNKAKIRSQAIHGNKSQRAREMALESIKKGESRVLVATDIAARGIDIDQVSHVFNFDIPNVPESYVHRIGRTARAGASGVAIGFCSVDERPYLSDIERVIQKKIPISEFSLGQINANLK